MGLVEAAPEGRPRRDDGFTIVEALVAVTILSVAIVLSIQPVMGALRNVSDARVISVSENLAQAEVEMVRSLDYEEVGLPGRTPSGSLTESREITVEGRRYVLDLDIQYAGSVTGLNVIPQGGDGVEGTWDPGVDYKVVQVTVTADGRERDPIIMETIVAPTRVGQHEGIANAKVHVAAHEPFAPGNYDLPEMKIHAPPSPEIRSGVSASEQVFPAIPSGNYTALIEGVGVWIIHPDDLIAGLDQLAVTSGFTAETTLRVYRPATLTVEVFDADTLAPVADASLRLTHVPSGNPTQYAPGEYVAGGLIPDAYDVVLTAPGYFDWTLTSLNIPAAYPSPNHQLTAYMDPIPPPTTTTSSTSSTSSSSTTSTTSGGSTTTSSSSTSTTSTSTTSTTVPAGNRIPVEFTVVDNRNMVVAGADVVVSHPTDGVHSGITDVFGRITFNLLDGEQYTGVGSTDWGHGSDTDPVNVGGWIDALELRRPWGRGTMTLTGGDNAEFLYRISESSPWTVMPANFEAKASFVDWGGWFEVAKRCLSNGQVEGAKWVKITANNNKTTTVWGWCP